MLGTGAEAQAQLAGPQGCGQLPCFRGSRQHKPFSCPGPRLHTCPPSKGRMTAGSKGASQKLQGPSHWS